MTVDILLVLMAVFVVKHFICDFPLQSFPYMYLNKGTYGHPGGILHAAIHGAASFIILLFYLPFFIAFVLAMMDMWVHYNIDWAKMRLGSKYNLKPDNSEWFWILLGVDQLLHYLTYVFIIFIVAKWPV